MTPTEFCYWLRGYLELHPGPDMPCLNKEQTNMVNRHLDLVFNQPVRESEKKVLTERHTVSVDETVESAVGKLKKLMEKPNILCSQESLPQDVERKPACLNKKFC